MRVADDGLTASVDIVAGDAGDARQLQEALSSAGIVFGVDEDAVHRLGESLELPASCSLDTVVAVGVPALEGSDGYFVPAFEPGIKPGHLDEDGKMDLHDRELLKPVQVGALLGVVHPAVPGTPGRRVDGGVLAVRATREVALALGPGVTGAADGQLWAASAGVILYVPRERLDVVHEHVHHSDVDLRSGHLDMAGSLRVHGDVTRSFKVRATGDVEITGSVCDGSVYAGGSLSVRGNVLGGSDGELVARGAVHVRNAERAQIRTRGPLQLDAAVHCQLEAATIEVGVVRGGEARAERSVIAREAGATSGRETKLVAGEPLQRAHDDVRAALSSAKDERSRQRARGGDDSERARRARPSLEREQLERLVALRRERARLLQTAQVVVQTMAHPGVIIQLGDARITLTQATAATRFTYHAPSRSIRSERYVP